MSDGRDGATFGVAAGLEQLSSAPAIPRSMIPKMKEKN
jgi:hypothetical protein